ncbi:MAG: hypothetical protein Q9187_003703 [Circinaria calcarea]
MGYGFSIEGNKADAFALALVTSKSKNVRYILEKEMETGKGQESSIAPAETPTNQEIQVSSNKVTFMSKMNNNSASLRDGEQSHLKVTHPLSEIFHLRPPICEALSSINQDLFDTLSVMVANQRELTSVHVPSSRSWIRHLDGQPTHNDITVACRLLGFLQQQHAKIIEHTDDLPPSPQNVKQFHAARYRRSQLYILQSIMIALKSFLSNIISVKRRVAGLEDIVSHSPVALSTQFRAALHCTLGTRKPHKLREAGYQDLVFTIWVCTLWLCYANKDLKALRERAVNKFHKDAFGWLSFVHASYGPPPGWAENTCVKSGCSIHRLNVRGSEEALEERAIVESYLKVIRAAAAINSDSLYADGIWTAEYLRWGHYIVQEEGFMCPKVDDEDGGSEDEFMIFFEDGEEKGL